MTNKTKHHDKNLFFRYCLYWFSGSRVLKGHVKNSLAINLQNQFNFLRKINTLIFKILKDHQKHHLYNIVILNVL